MHHFTYSTVVAEGPAVARAGEREVILRSIELMEAAEHAGPGSREVVDAVYFINRLWCHMIEDLGSQDNNLPKELRAKLISIGLYLMRRANEVREAEGGSFRGMINISQTIADGLK